MTSRYQMESDLSVDCLVDARNVVGEGPLWHPDHNSIYWTDINGFKIFRCRLDGSEVTEWKFLHPVTSLSLTTDPGLLLVAVGGHVILWAPETDKRSVFAQPERAWPSNRLNDGAADPNGNYWVGSMFNNVSSDGGDLEITTRSGSLYRVDPYGEVTQWDTGFGIPNTFVWSPDRRFFYCACSMENVIYQYDFDSLESSIQGRRPFCVGAERGVPDGSAIDSEGFLWNCRFFGGCLLRISPTGKVDRVLDIPVKNPTHCAFGGPDLKTLFVTSASLHAPANERFSGGLFKMQVDVQGTQTWRFRLPNSSKELLPVR